ncbi:MAG: 1-deoxy-D-xylulose-5-phosphate reductoisomerase [Clostridia bacterium]|nr:1-deoxy-D-xylulose-5-phosphate reductoisomerase [Clostridia bacterium]
MREIAILGSTGSIGTQALSVIEAHPDRFHAVALVARTSAETLFAQVRRFRPRMAGLVQKPIDIPEDLLFCEWVFGEACLRTAATLSDASDVLVSVVGFAGLPAVLAALSAGKRVLLANKEALVAGGELVTDAARKAGQLLMPVDSEHSAILQCLRAADGNAPKRLILTASGGPFRTWSAEQVASATAKEALTHPNWTMGKKITVDSASMMNKALEVIEAHWLFGLPPDRIDVLIHKESVIHSMVEFEDGAVLAQLGVPDMRIPIQYAMSYPERLPSASNRIEFAQLASLTFEKPDMNRFPGLSLAYEALNAGGAAPCILNAANECAVEAFLQDRIPFNRIWQISRDTLERLPACPARTLSDVVEADGAARRMALTLV